MDGDATEMEALPGEMVRGSIADVGDSAHDPGHMSVSRGASDPRQVWHGGSTLGDVDADNHPQEVQGSARWISAVWQGETGVWLTPVLARGCWWRSKTLGWSPV